MVSTRSTRHGETWVHHRSEKGKVSTRSIRHGETWVHHRSVKGKVSTRSTRHGKTWVHDRSEKGKVSTWWVHDPSDTGKREYMVGQKRVNWVRDRQEKEVSIRSAKKGQFSRTRTLSIALDRSGLNLQVLWQEDEENPQQHSERDACHSAYRSPRPEVGLQCHGWSAPR